MLSLPSFYFPTTTVLVDDDNLFLQGASQLVDPRRLKTFNDPYDCIRFFDAYSRPLTKMSFLRGLTEDDRYWQTSHAPVDLNVSALHQIYHSAERSDEISIIIVDYKMPGMKGIELCRKLHSQSVKKILLTGEATHEEAISAFNDNTIDRFIRKDSATLVKDIQKHIFDLKHQYFYEQTQPLLSHLEVDYKLPQSDPVFINFFQNLCATHLIKEYYLIDKNGSLILVDNENKISYLIIHTDRSLNEFIKLNNDINGAEHYANLINQHRQIPFFGISKESWQFEINEWPKYFFTSESLDGRDKYYFSIVKQI